MTQMSSQTAKEPLSPKQIDSFLHSNKRLNVWEGSVRSGKSFISLLRFVKALREHPPGNCVIVGVSRDSIQRNVMGELSSLIGMPVPTPKSTQLSLYGHTIFLVGASDERSQRKIQGSTLQLAFVDEITNIPEGFFKMLLSRLSKPGAQLFGSTNPDSPFHWLKTEFLDKEKELDIARFHFTLDDNPSLDKVYVDSIKREYTGLWFRRYINGEWCLADGTVYDFFDEKTNVIEKPPGFAEYYVVGIDYGTVNSTAFVMVGVNTRTWPNLWVEKEYYYDSRKQGRQKTDTDTVEDLKAFVSNHQVRCIYVDPSAASLKIEMMREGIEGIRDANNDVISGIRFVSKVMGNGTLKICANCKNMMQEMATYRWDGKACAKGEDKVLKENDHSLDALRYVIYTHFKDKLSISDRDIDMDDVYRKTFAGNHISILHGVEGVPSYMNG